MEYWRKVVFSRVEIWWNVGSKNGETRVWQVCHRWWYGLWHRHRIEPFAKVKVILAQAEWSIAKDIGPFFKRCNARHRQTFFYLVNVYVFDIGSICIHGKESLRQFTFHQKYRRRSHFKADVRHIWKVDSGTFRGEFVECLTSAWKIHHGNNYLWSMMKKSSVSRMQRFMYSQILCYVLERWIRTQHQIVFGKNSWVGSKIHHNTELWTRSTENRWNSSGIFSQDSPHCSSSTKSKSSWTKWATQHNSKDELSSCRCSLTSYGDLKTMNGNALLMPHLWLYLHIDFHQDDGHSSDPGSEKKWYSTNIDRPRGEWDRVAELMMIKFGESGHPVFRATSPLSRGTLKSKGGGQLSIHFCVDGDTIETVFRTIISVNQLSIYAAVSDLCDEYSACQARTVRPVLARQSDDCWWQHLHLRLKFLHKEI